MQRARRWTSEATFARVGRAILRLCCVASNSVFRLKLSEISTYRRLRAISLTKKDTAMSELLDMQELKEHVRVNNKSGIVTCLSQLRNEPLRCKNFIKHGGLNILVNLLRNPNSTILNMCLSILANACISSDAREKVRDSNIGDNIIHIMKNHALDSTVHCRVCRLVGNLSECSWHAKSLYNNGVVESLTTFLKLKTTRQTYLMAIRAIRNIWSVYEGSREKILQLQAVRQIAQLFVMASEKTKVNTKYAELVDVCLKAMCTFLVTQDEIADLVRCSAQMEADKDKQGYKILIECCKVGNNLAIKCLCSLCLLTGCRLVLGTLGAAELLITLTKNGSTNGELSRQLLVTLCLFCQESVHRMKMKAAGLEVFVILLKRPQLEKYHPMLLDALMQFAYCDNSIITLTKHGLLEVLMTKLMDSIADTAVLDETSELRPVNNINASNKRCYGSTPCRKYSRISEGRCNRYYTLHRFDGDSSPGSSTSVSSSPPSTPPLLYYDSMMETDIDDDNYSPVYSDTEWGDDEEPQDEEADSLKSCKSLIINADNSRDSEKTSKGILCDSTVLMLLYRVSLLPLPIDRLADPMTIKSLLIYINRTKNEKAITILNRIVRNAAYFMPLLKQGFVFDAQGMPEREEYLHHLREVAETGGAIGQLSSMLLRGEEQHKLIFAVSIPFLIVQSRVTLRSLLHNHGGLQMILRLLSDPTHELHERAIWSICRLAVSLQIQPETVDKCSMSASDSLSFRTCIRDNHNPLPLSIVTFELDDGTTVDACRSILCQRSDAFSAMLEGNFSESGKRRVRLRNASRDGLNTLILAASGSAYKHRSIESLLDAVLLADKFLMPDLSDALTDSSVAKLSHENFSRAWWWAKTNACHELRSCCVKTFLTANMTNSQTVQAFRDFFATAAFEDFLCEIREIIMDVLCQP